MRRNWLFFAIVPRFWGPESNQRSLCIKDQKRIISLCSYCTIHESSPNFCPSETKTYAFDLFVVSKVEKFKWRKIFSLVFMQVFDGKMEIWILELLIDVLLSLSIGKRKAVSQNLNGLHVEKLYHKGQKVHCTIDLSDWIFLDHLVYWVFRFYQLSIW